MYSEKEEEERDRKLYRWLLGVSKRNRPDRSGSKKVEHVIFGPVSGSKGETAHPDRSDGPIIII